MPSRLYVNNFSTKLTSQLLVAGTTANITAGNGAALAGANGTDWFVGTLRRMSGFRDVAREIVKITLRTVDALTITRAQEGTTALQFEIGDQLDIDFTAASFTDAIPVALPGVLTALGLTSWTWGMDGGGNPILTLVESGSGKTFILGPFE